MGGHVLSVAGSDSGGGAGLQADLKTLTAHGVYAGSVVTALTAQNTMGVQDVHTPPVAFVGAQLDSVLGDMKFSVVKTGMIPTAGLVGVVCEKLRKYGVKKVIVDPVMVATSGDALAGGDEWMKIVKKELIPMAFVITPNIAEAEMLVGRPIRTERDVRDACREIASMGARFVLLKGGHVLAGDEQDMGEDLHCENVATDVLFDGVRFQAYSAPRLESDNTHGTGCTLAAAIAANVALGDSVPEAVKKAKQFVFEAIRTGFNAGSGVGVLNHMHGIKRAERSL